MVQKYHFPLLIPIIILVSFKYLSATESKARGSIRWTALNSSVLQIIKQYPVLITENQNSAVLRKLNFCLTPNLILLSTICVNY